MDSGYPEGVLSMNRRLFASAFALAGAAAFAMPAYAQTAAPAPTNAAPASQAAPGNLQARQLRPIPPVNSRQCIRDTGSHIPPPKGQCLPVAGNSYSHEDLQRTGAVDLGRALQMLDPSVRGH
ncbi:MAG TPA: hypothetical protein VFY94_10600 [Rhodanobacteraceae bacterium]|nr:hypothetical protein [Rhodanobacteraceae bacterium]